jgi:CHAT domain-containing protein
MARKKTKSVISEAEQPAWTILFYLCGDHPELSDDIEKDVEEILRVRPSKQFQIVLQCDSYDKGARRMVLKRGVRTTVEQLGSVNTGDPDRAVEFLVWGIDKCPAENVAVVFGGIGIADGRSTAKGAAGQYKSLFACCDDVPARDALDAAELRYIVQQVLQKTRRQRIQLIAFDMCEMQYLELAYQLEQLVDVMIGSQTPVHDSGWPYDLVLTKWKKALAGPPPIDACKLAAMAVDEIAKHAKPKNGAPVTMSALNLNLLTQVTPVFDTFFLALMQSLGDGMVYEARKEAIGELVKNHKRRQQHTGGESADALHAVDLAELFRAVAESLESFGGSNGQIEKRGGRWLVNWFKNELEKVRQRDEREYKRTVEILGLVTAAKLRSPNAAALDRNLEAHFQHLPESLRREYQILKDERQRTRHLAQLARRSLEVLAPADALAATTGEVGERERSGDAIRQRFVIKRAPQDSELCGVSIFRPVNLAQLQDSNYLALNFHRHVHWTALLGAIHLIDEHPRALWRMVSSMLATAGGQGRDELLRRISGPDSVVAGFQDQFQSLNAPPSVTLSMSEEEQKFPTGEGAEEHLRNFYRLRLESSQKGATVAEKRSRVNPRTIQNALDILNRLLQQPWMNADDLRQVESMGRTLGEDIIQDLSQDLQQEWDELEKSQYEGPLHMQLQLPRELMQYPWEMMHDGDRLLCDKYALGRQVFMDSGLARRVPRRKPGPVRVLIIGDPLLDQQVLDDGWCQLKGAVDEARHVALHFQRLHDELGGAVDFQPHRDLLVHEHVSAEQLRDLLRQGDYDMIHFAGHGIFQPDDPEQSAWILSDGPLWALQLRNTLRLCDSPPWLVFANACEAGMDKDKGFKEVSNRYQPNVFGLATAFINYGVAAYIAPLWKINDAIAMQIAAEFYSQLLLQRASLGEALWHAKRSAKAATLGSADDFIGSQTLAGMSWASLVLYGDPTSKMMQSLGGTQAAATEGAGLEPPPSQSCRSHRPASPPPSEVLWTPQQPRRPMQAWMEDLDKLVSGPGMERVDATRSADQIPPDKSELRLIDVNGVRFWQYYDPERRDFVSLDTFSSEHRGRSEKQRGPNLEQLLRENSKMRGMLGIDRGKWDYFRVFGRWLIGREERGLIGGLAQQYDANTVPAEQLLTFNQQGAIVPVGREGILGRDGRQVGENDRLLLLIHGTFSKSRPEANGLGLEFLHWAQDRYAAVLAFDHWTLSRSPEENAEKLWEALQNALPKNDGPQNRYLDVISHSRGGLVARAFVELCNHGGIVSKVALVATPNAGTDLANPDNIARAADVLVNMVPLDPEETFGKLSGFLARLAATMGAEAALRQVPGLWAQCPVADDPKDFLVRLQSGKGPPSGVTYSAIAANYEPRREINLSRLLMESLDESVDNFFLGKHNDLIVNTSNVWAVDVRANSQKLPTWLHPKRVMVFSPPNNDMPIPQGAVDVSRSGVNHNNIYALDETREFLKRMLSKGKP